MATIIFFLKRDMSRRQLRIERFGKAYPVFATLNETVNALMGDVPGGSLERLGQPSRYLTVVCNALMSGPSPQLCRGQTLVGLRRSLARIRVIHVTEQLSVMPYASQSIEAL